MKRTIFTLLVLVVIASCKKESFSSDLTREFTIHSVSSNADYHIKVAIPKQFDPSVQKLATLYVLDGEENFDFVANQCKDISTNLGTSNVLVVSIGYGNDRAVDYTPTKAEEGGGGAEKFMLFVQDELIPKIESDFGADTIRESRAILGHSFGGLLGAYAFTNHNKVFGNYILLSPSLWYDNEVTLRFEKQHRDTNKNNQQLVFLGLGEMENGGRMLAPFMAFCQLLKNHYPAMTFSSHLEPRLDHRGSENPNITKGLNFYFRNR